jgi:hypothetical protein
MICSICKQDVDYNEIVQGVLPEFCQGCYEKMMINHKEWTRVFDIGTERQMVERLLDEAKTIEEKKA